MRASVARAATGLADAGIEASLGSCGDRDDNALAESVIGLCKTVVIRHAGPWRGLEDVEFATLEWVAWRNASRLLEPLGYHPQPWDEAQYHEAQTTPAVAGALTWTRPLRIRGGSVAGNPGAFHGGVEHVDGR